MSEAADKPKKRKRRWWRYSLRTFLLLLTTFGVWLGLLVHRVNKQKEAVQWVREHGGAVYYDFQWDADFPFSVHPDAEPHGPDWLRELIGVEYFAEVSAIDLDDTRVSHIHPLRQFRQLQVLTVQRTPVSDLRPLSELTALKWLFLGGTQVSDLSPLAELNDVEIDLGKNQQVNVPKELMDRVSY